MPVKASANDLGQRGLAVEVVRLGKAYQNFWALRHVSFEVRCGECVGIIGYNGAGKSTLLQLIAGTLSPTEGSVETNGRIVCLLELGAGFNGDLSGRENLYLGAALLGVDRDTLDKHMHEIETFAEIGPFFEQPVRTYSSGMIMRLAFSLLTQVQPDIMIIDEALAVGDAYFAHKCMRMIQRFRDEGRSLLFVSHDAAAIKSFCDRAILLEKGTVLQQGPPEQILDYYNAMIAVRERDTQIQQTAGKEGRVITRSGNGLATISKVELLDIDNRPVRAVLCGSTVTICCLVEFSSLVENPTIGFLIRDRLGNDVFGTNTFNLQHRTGKYGSEEKIEVAFKTQLNLGAGHYSITFAVHTGRSHIENNFDWCNNLLAFSIVAKWPFEFAGVAALEASVNISTNLNYFNRRYQWGESISFSSDGNATRFKVSGWCAPEPNGCWSSGANAQLLVQLPVHQLILMRAYVTPFLAGSLDVQKVELWSNLHQIAYWEIAGPNCIEAQLHNKNHEGISEIDLTWYLPTAQSPSELNHSQDTRVLGLKFSSIEFIRIS